MAAVKFKSGVATTERIIDYLAEEEKQATRKAGKKERIAKLLKNVVAAQPQPVIDFLGD